MTTFENVKGIIANQLKVDESTITMESNIIADLKADSLDLFYIVMDLEEMYKISLTDDDIVTTKTVGDAVNLIDSKKK